MTMAVLVSWLISALVLVLLVTFALYLIGLRALPLRARPRTPTYDRFGRFTEMAENPDYRENPGEDRVIGPDVTPPGM